MPANNPAEPAFVERYGPWVLILGASEGLGAEFASQVAAKGADCVLVARRPEKLDALAAELVRRHGVKVETRALDLAEPDAAARLKAAVVGIDIGLVIFNAGGDKVGTRFLESPFEAWDALNRRNIGTLAATCHHFGGKLVERGRGGLVLVGSDAAFGGGSRLSVYTASKGYQLNLGESLWYELRPKGVDVLNVVIGATDTPGLREALEKHGMSIDNINAASTTDVVSKALASLNAGPTLVFGVPEDGGDALNSGKLRRQRVEQVSEFMKMFYGPE